MTIRIDAHQHYWEPRRGDYDWMPQDDPILSRKYMPADLAASLTKHGIAQTVLVQAAATVEETEYMLGIADASDTVAAVVGWVDFENPDHRNHIERLARHPKFKGLRPMIQDIPDVDWMLRDEVQWAYKTIVDLDLTFDALGYSRHLDNFLTLLRRCPDMRVVIDHGMKPPIRDRAEHDEVNALWYVGPAAGGAMVERASIGNLKQTWTNHGKARNWFDPAQGEGPEFLRRATQVKNIWVPYGE